MSVSFSGQVAAINNMLSHPPPENLRDRMPSFNPAANLSESTDLALINRDSFGQRLLQSVGGIALPSLNRHQSSI